MAINTIDLPEYQPTKYIDLSEPDVDALHLNHTEQGLKQVTDAARKVIDEIKNLDTSDKVDIMGGDISNTKITSFSTAVENYPVPAAGDSTKTVLGKIKKFFDDIQNWMAGVCLIGQIVNNCVTNRSDLPGSAAQLKVLMDLCIANDAAVDRLNSDITQLNGEMFSRAPIYISGPPAGQDTSYVFSVSTTFKIQQIDIPVYSKGIFVATSNDGVLIAVSEDTKTVIAFRSNGVWGKARIL